MNEQTKKILLGNGVFKVSTVPVALTRGGGTFEVETEYRDIVADGDKGPVKGRQTIDSQVARLGLNVLTAFNKEEFKKYYPTLVDDAGEIRSDLKIKETDYHDVEWTGRTLDDDRITIKLENAINLENIDFTLEDKDEVIPELTYTATYSEDARETPPWSITFDDAEGLNEGTEE